MSASSSVSAPKLPMLTSTLVLAAESCVMRNSKRGRVSLTTLWSGSGTRTHPSSFAPISCSKVRVTTSKSSSRRNCVEGKSDGAVPDAGPSESTTVLRSEAVLTVSAAAARRAEVRRKWTTMLCHSNRPTLPAACAPPPAEGEKTGDCGFSESMRASPQITTPSSSHALSYPSTCSSSRTLWTPGPRSGAMKKYGRTTSINATLAMAFFHETVSRRARATAGLIVSCAVT